jgi:uncharacterized protein (TIGR03437 family)
MESYGFGEPACSPASSTTTVTCNTDQFGFAYTEVVLGSQVGSFTVNVSAGGITVQADAEAFSLQPTITSSPLGVVNNATFGSAVAPGSYVAIFGSDLLDTSYLSGYSFYSNLNYDVAQADNLASDGSLPLQLDEVSVSFDVPSAGISVPGYVYFVSPTQVNAFVPWELAGQSSVQMKVILDEFLLGNVVTVPLQTYAPGFFLNTENVADALDSSYKLITASNAAVRGQTIQLYANGLGPVSNRPASGSPALGIPLSTTTTTPVVTIGGQPATVLFSGLVPGVVGEYQLNVTVPAGIAAGNQPIVVSIGGQSSPATTAGSSPQTIVIPVK